MVTPVQNYVKDINDVHQYRPCRKKVYEIWMCRPPVGTIVVNMLEQPQSVQYLNGKTFFTVKELRELQTKAPASYQQLMAMVQQGAAYRVGEADCVLSGTRGEMWITKIAKVVKTYQCRENGAWSFNWEHFLVHHYVHPKGKDGKPIMEADGHTYVSWLPWVKIRAGGEKNPGTVACFVPASQIGQIKTEWATLTYNAPGVEHGRGDFIVGMAGNLSDRWVVNGLVFTDTYNNNGFEGQVSRTSGKVNAPRPRPLF